MEIILRYRNRGESKINEIRFADYCPFGFWMAQNCEEIEVVECIQEEDFEWLVSRNCKKGRYKWVAIVVYIPKC